MLKHYQSMTPPSSCSMCQPGSPRPFGRHRNLPQQPVLLGSMPLHTTKVSLWLRITHTVQPHTQPGRFCRS